MINCHKRWKYLNEGNVHIVLQVLNSDYVIRLIKEDEKVVSYTIVNNSVHFVNSVMTPLIFGSHCYKEEIVAIPSTDFVELSTLLKNWRPKHRQVKSVINPHAIQAPNFTILTSNTENYCLEIKPKEGFLATNLKSTTKCYYCLKQFLKLDDLQIKSISSYCPLDLFSGDASRMKLALMSLLETPQNNLKLFKNGTIVYNETSNINDIENLVQSMHIFSSVNIFLDFIINILAAKNSNVTLHETHKVNFHSKQKNCNEEKILSKDSFLYKLLKVQKISDNLQFDIVKTNEEFKYVSSILEIVESLNIDLTNEIDRKKFIETLSPEQLGIISAVAKDCSIMIAFSPEPNKNLPYLLVNGRRIFYRVAVTDLEPKSIKTLEKRINTEIKLLNMHKKLSHSEN